MMTGRVARIPGQPRSILRKAKYRITRMGHWCGDNDLWVPDESTVKSRRTPAKRKTVVAFIDEASAVNDGDQSKKPPKKRGRIQPRG